MSGRKTYLSELFTKFNIFLLAWTDPIGWVIIRNPKSLLDLGCGQGKPLMMIKLRTNVERSVGVDIYKPYVKEAKKRNIYDELMVADVRKVSFPRNSFDVVLASQIIEHLGKKEALRFLRRMEGIARKQVIISTPIGEIESPDSSQNRFQAHKSSFVPSDFEALGYKTIKYGWRWLLAPNGLAMTTKSPVLRRFFYFLNFILTPVYYLWQDSCDYSFTAYKYL